MKDKRKALQRVSDDGNGFVEPWRAYTAESIQKNAYPCKYSSKPDSHDLESKSVGFQSSVLVPK